MTAIQQNMFHLSRAPNVLWDNIPGLASYLSNFIALFRNPSFYSYALDGNSTYIVDGGNDMFDAFSNLTTPALISGATYAGGPSVSPTTGSLSNYPFRISYAAEDIIVDGDFRYASLGYGASKLPLTVIGARYSPSSNSGWQKGGNGGADGFGSISTSSGTLTSGPLTIRYFFRSIWGAGDPSICDVFMLVTHTNWGSIIGTPSTTSSFSTDNIGCAYRTTGSTNVLAITTLLSKASGVEVTSANVSIVVSNYASRIREYFQLLYPEQGY